jgi:hypothetical protein
VRSLVTEKSWFCENAELVSGITFVVLQIKVLGRRVLTCLCERDCVGGNAEKL